jgi:type II secretory pathway pseudopilin PulG
MPANLVLRRRPFAGFTLIELAVAFVIVAVLIALFLPATRTPREASRRTQCKNNLKQIGLALHNYHDTWGAFPPAYTVDSGGRPLHSWRTLILPYLDQATLFNRIDLSKPWDDRVNAEAFQTKISTYACPSSPTLGDKSVYLAVVTDRSCLGPGRSRQVNEITDGTSNTIIVIEVPHDQAVPWYAPQDADAAVLQSFGSTSKETHVGGRHSLMADGAVRFISQNLDQQTFEALLTAASGDTVGEF